MLEHFRILKSRIQDKILIITPVGDGHSFRYGDLQTECNGVRRKLEKPEVEHLVIDFSQLKYFGSEYIGALISLARLKSDLGGKAIFCAANEDMQRVLENMKLTKLWPYFDHFDDALTALGVVIEEDED